MLILGFDSDLIIKDGVWKAVRELGEWLKISRHTDVQYCLLPHEGDGKTGLDDYLAGGHTVDDLWNLVQIDLPKSGKEEKQAAPEAQTIHVDVDGNKLLQEIREWLGPLHIHHH